MSTKRAGIAAIGSKDAIIKVSFDKLQTFVEIPGVVDFNRTSGAASIYEGQPLREEGFVKPGSLSNGAMSFSVFQTPQMPVFDKLIDAHANKDLIYIEPAIPREVVATFTDQANPVTSIAIADTGLVTFVPNDFPIDDQPLGKGCVIEIGMQNFVITEIDIDEFGNVATRVEPKPANDLAAGNAEIVFPGLRWGAMGAYVVDYTDTFGNDGSATTAFNLRISGQPSKVTIDRTIT